MIDIHTHLIPNVDDGSKSIEDTIDIFKEAQNAGFTDIILTSHFMLECFETKKDDLIFWKENLQKVNDEKNININLHSGMEIYISEKIDELIKDEKLLTLANSRYILMELPMVTTINYLDYCLYFLQSVGLKLIIAHPERYKAVQENPDLVKDYVEKGCLMQCNYGSILGSYGKDAKNTIKYLLKKDLVHFVATDCHKKGRNIFRSTKGCKKNRENYWTTKYLPNNYIK